MTPLARTLIELGFEQHDELLYEFRHFRLPDVTIDTRDCRDVGDALKQIHWQGQQAGKKSKMAEIRQPVRDFLELT